MHRARHQNIERRFPLAPGVYRPRRPQPCLDRTRVSTQPKQASYSTDYAQICRPNIMRGTNDRKDSLCTGTTQKAITNDGISELEVPLPPHSEQKRLVRILIEADALRRIAAQAERRLGQVVFTLFDDIFGDPATNPKNWPVSPLGELLVSGPQNGLYKHSSSYGKGTPILRIDAFYDGVITDVRSLKRLEVTQEELSKYQLNDGDIVINRVNSPEYL